MVRQVLAGQEVRDPGEELRLEGLGAEVVRAEVDGAKRMRTIVLTGQHDHLGFR